MNLNENIFKLRKKNNFSQEELAEQIGVSRQTISNWELGETSPNPEQLKMLSNVFNVSVDDLLDNDVKNVIVEKVNKTEKNTNFIMKNMKYILIGFIILLVIDVMTFIYFYINKIGPFDSEKEEVGTIYTTEYNKGEIKI